MNFVRFDGYARKGHKPLPHTMAVGQIIERSNPCRVTRHRLMEDMREAMKQGMEFSTAEELDIYAIRRDK